MSKLLQNSAYGSRHAQLRSSVRASREVPLSLANSADTARLRLAGDNVFQGLLAITITLLLVNGCSISDENYQLNEDIVSATGEPRLLFTLPDCLPSCNAADKARLIASGHVENHIVSAINNASTSVDFATFTFSRKPIFEALISAAVRGVRVRGLLGKNQFSTYSTECQTSGCNFEEFNNPEFLSANVNERRKLAEKNQRFKKASLTEKLAVLFYKLPNGSVVKKAVGSRRLVHHKLLIVDNQTLVSGSGNWSSTAVSVNLENLVTLTSPGDKETVKSFVCMFETIWSGDGSFISKNLKTCQTPTIFFSPMTPSLGIIPQLTNAISNAKSSIDISMHHLVHPDVIEELNNALQDNTGKQVRIIFDDDDCPLKTDAALEQLVSNGAKFRYVPTSCSLYQLSHNKFGIFDNEKVINGSGNWSKAGLSKNYENFVIYNDDKDVETFQRFYNTAWEKASPKSICSCDLTTEECKKRYCR